MLKYHWLVRHHLLPQRFLMRPLLNCSTAQRWYVGRTPLGAGMTEAEALARFSLNPKPTDLAGIRAEVVREISRQRADVGDLDLLRILCVQLFAGGEVQDALLFWMAKSSSFDAGCGIDVQLLCGSGLADTTSFLAVLALPDALEALSYINQCESAGDFDDFSPTTRLEEYRSYYA